MLEKVATSPTAVSTTIEATEETNSRNIIDKSFTKEEENPIKLTPEEMTYLKS